MPDRLLVIDDSREDTDLLELALREARLDVRVDAICDGDSAWQRIDAINEGAERAPALVLLDLNLPGRSGRELLEHIRSLERLADLPIAVLTGSVAQRQEIETLGVDAYFVKPTRWSDLLELVEELRTLLPARAPPDARARAGPADPV